MKFLKRFEEINPKDILFISDNLDNYFTIAFEFEIETNDNTGYTYDFSQIDGDLIDDVYDDVVKELKLTSRSQKNYLRNICDILIDYYNQSTLDPDSFEKIFQEFDTVQYSHILLFLKSILLSQITEKDFDYLKDKAEVYLSKFFEKWGSEVEFIQDVTLDRGIEIKPKKYVVGISKSIEMIEDFYSSLQSQSYWNFADTTGLHINIGSTQKVSWNPIKGLLMMNDYSKDVESVPLVFKDMTWRHNNKFCGSLIQSIYEMSSEQKREIKDKINFTNIQESESLLNKFITQRLVDQGFKNFGFNITRISSDYIEFRYAGGNIRREVLIDKLKYFCFLVYCMTNVQYKRKEYLNKLYKFIDSL